MPFDPVYSYFRHDCLRFRDDRGNFIEWIALSRTNATQRNRIISFLVLIPISWKLGLLFPFLSSGSRYRV